MKKKKFLIATQIIISLFVVTSLVYGGERFNAIADLKDNTKLPPTIIMRSDGDYIALWEEITEQTEYEPRHYYYYYRIVNSKGEIIVNKREFKDWRMTDWSDWGLTFSSKSSVGIESDKLLIIAWKLIHATANPPGYRLERLILNSSGEIFTGPDTINVNAYDVLLLKDSQGLIYAMENSRGLANYFYNFMQVYPQIDSMRGILSISLNKQYRRTQDWVAIFTCDDNFLICTRTANLPGKSINEIPKGWVGMPNHLICFLVDIKGRLVTDPIPLTLTKDAFRKIPGIHLGGDYSYKPWKCASGDLDLTCLPNDEIILSVTGLDDKMELCVYQVKFTAKGRLVKPNSMLVVKPKRLLNDLTLPISKIAIAEINLGLITGKNKFLIRREYILFGFDEEGNFYATRTLWKEGEE